MALQLLGSIEDDKVRFYFDVDTKDTVQGVRLENDLTASVRVEVTRQSTGQVLSQVCAPGITTATLPNNRKFRYAEDLLADWGFSLAVI